MDQIERIAALILSELNHFSETFTLQGATAQIYQSQHQLRDEPFIAYLETRASGRTELFLICRNYVPVSTNPLAPNASFASYLAPVGRLMTAEPGQTEEVKVPDPHLQHFHVTAYEIIGKDEFHPKQD